MEILKLDTKTTMNNTRKFVYNTGRTSKNPACSSQASSSRNMSREECGNDGGKEDEFNLNLDFDDDDDITSTMSEADFDRMEREASRKLGLYHGNGSKDFKNVQVKQQVWKNSQRSQHTELFDNINIDEDVDIDKGKAPYKVKEEGIVNKASTSSCHQQGSSQPDTMRQLHKLSAQLEEYRKRVSELEGTLCSKDGELKILRSSLEKHREESSEKSEKIVELKNKNTLEQNQREANLIKEVSSLKTRLSFQEQELREQSKKFESKPSGGLKRKAESSVLNGSFDLENSFASSQHTSSKKMARLSEKLPRSVEMSDVVTSQSVKGTAGNIQHHKADLITMSEHKGVQLAKNLIHNINITSNYNNEQEDTEPMSLLNLLKYPLLHLPEILEAHSVNTLTTDRPSQFPHWQSQRPQINPGEKSVDIETLDLDSGKYNLINQGLLLLLGFSSTKKVTPPEGEIEPSLGVTHILVLLELYISSYLFKQKRMNNDSYSLDTEENLNKATENEKQTFIECQEMVLQSLQLLKVLLYSAPQLVKCILDRSNPTVFLLNDNVIVIEDDPPEQSKGSSDDHTTSNLSQDEFQDNMGSFRSLLLANLEKLLDPYTVLKNVTDESLTISHAALQVLVAMTTTAQRPELESICHFLKRGSLSTLLLKDSSISTILLVLSLLKNLLPCKRVQKILCSQTDNCMLLKIYQCICDEEDKETSNAVWDHFLLQVIQFVKSVAFSHSDSILFLLETDCQCSLEIIRCLILVLHDKVNYLLDLEDTDLITSDPSLAVLRVGVTLLVILCTHPSYSPDHKLDVEHHYVELICKVMILYKIIKHVIPDFEALGVQDLLDLEQIEEIEWSLGSDDEDCMEIDE